MTEATSATTGGGGESSSSVYPPPPTATATDTTFSARGRSPQPSTSRQENHNSSLSSYNVSTETQSVSDLRLRITEDHSTSPSSSSSVQRSPPRPIYFREKSLNNQEEIVDALIDANTGQTKWTIHRPSRGWYLHIRSPNLPPSFTIPIRPARPEYVISTMGINDPTCTPLTFSIGTKVQAKYLAQCKEWIADVEQRQASTPAQANEGFSNVELNDRQQEAQQRSVSATSEVDGIYVKGHSAKTSSISSTVLQQEQSQQQQQQQSGSGSGMHTRRRSAASNTIGGTSPAPSPDMRRMNLSGKFPKVVESVDENAEQDGHDKDLLRTPQNNTNSTCNQGRFSPNDQPYKAASNKSPTASSSRPTQCYFLLVDGSGRVSSHTPASTIQSSPPGRTPAEHRLGFAKKIWSFLPDPIRPNLSFDTSKSFSIRWIEIENNNNTSSIEVLRYEDTTGYWLWQAKTNGRFVLQENAVKALAIDRGFWFAVGLAYLDFLEERDGYNAASDGG
ncbi:unnamed protein product [Sympodiomycopsis kandeliae]